MWLPLVLLVRVLSLGSAHVLDHQIRCHRVHLRNTSYGKFQDCSLQVAKQALGVAPASAYSRCLQPDSVVILLTRSTMLRTRERWSIPFVAINTKSCVGHLTRLLAPFGIE